jgi:hypothetical protein
MIIYSSKSVKKGQNLLNKATNWTYTCCIDTFFGLSNLKHINSCDMREKNAMTLYDFKTYFFPLGKVAASFLNLLSTAINNFMTRNGILLPKLF